MPKYPNGAPAAASPYGFSSHVLPAANNGGMQLVPYQQPPPPKGPQPLTTEELTKLYNQNYALQPHTSNQMYFPGGRAAAAVPQPLLYRAGYPAAIRQNGPCQQMGFVNSVAPQLGNSFSPQHSTFPVNNGQVPSQYNSPMPQTTPVLPSFSSADKSFPKVNLFFIIFDQHTIVIPIHTIFKRPRTKV